MSGEDIFLFFPNHDFFVFIDPGKESDKDGNITLPSRHGLFSKATCVHFSKARIIFTVFPLQAADYLK